MIEIMRKTICVLIVWNLILTGAFIVNLTTKAEAKPEQVVILPADLPELEPIEEAL